MDLCYILREVGNIPICKHEFTVDYQSSSTFKYPSIGNNFFIFNITVPWQKNEKL